MSNPISRKQIEKALQQKGFVPDQTGRDHRYYRFYYKGQKRLSKTKISTGTGYKDYDDNLFRLMVAGLHLENIKQVRDLLACPMTEEEYVAILVRRGKLPP